MAEPPITRRAAHDSGISNLPVRRIVIHATCPPRVPYPQASAPGQAAATAKYFQGSGAGGSAHYIYDAGGREEHCVPDKVIAWHAPPNAHSVGIEICGQATYTRQQWFSPQVWPAVEMAAKRTAELCARFSIPVRRLSVSQVREHATGICGHVDVSRAFGQTDHSDPGPGFPWDEFMAAVAGLKPQPPETWTETIVKSLPLLRLGAGLDKSEIRWHVKTLFYLLLARGFSLPSGLDDTVFGTAVEDAVRAFQKSVGLVVDGVVGPKTWAALLKIS